MHTCGSFFCPKQPRIDNSFLYPMICGIYYIWDSRQFFPALLFVYGHFFICLIFGVYQSIRNLVYWLLTTTTKEFCRDFYWQESALTHSLTGLLDFFTICTKRVWGIKWNGEHFGIFQSAMKHFFKIFLKYPTFLISQNSQ